MSIGDNVNLKDRLIKKTADKANNTNKANKTSKDNLVKTEVSVPYRTKKIATEDTKKATFYVKRELLQKLYNFAYWERHNITEAFNMVLTDGLKGKKTQNRNKK